MHPTKVRRPITIQKSSDAKITMLTVTFIAEGKEITCPMSAKGIQTLLDHKIEIVGVK